ncbi:hypothetical protein [Lentilactobacillus parakefiri]|uniref:Uncharacterized protein n=1 Tax=Lentilactobacillus parakefiri TaxID=152332 RepID=A0A269YI21_9LACO|nr:hypothetical protein [Lentilactobacillus parakefiri]KRL71982.1 hypothetical protein FD08_GL004612 [Lentilactobacillus parakefiri DSM 10551]PAK85069.1 hypothetical protein B8W98_04220 [Lentilactobacillus parakefiri]PAL01009.1 hypothetical protein B8W96_03655 [Lentilactobacillus parakefiri]TDG93411.1 hypothetical protein C5L28_000322 [Lentilactobacillus parakefiri]GAW71082.1 hypothetical protein LPKJCM_00153 [Lentilactobacillus parakefiri]
MQEILDTISTWIGAVILIVLIIAFHNYLIWGIGGIMTVYFVSVRYQIYQHNRRIDKKRTK